MGGVGVIVGFVAAALVSTNKPTCEDVESLLQQVRCIHFLLKNKR
jgi:hypothetical protein